MSRRRFHRFIRRVGSVFALAVLMVIALAMIPTAAHAESCGSGLLTISSSCVAVGMPVQNSGDKTCVEGAAACASRKPPDNPIANVVAPPAPAPPPRKPPGGVAPARPVPVTPVVPIRIREADIDPWFTSGTYEPTLPYRLPKILMPFDADAYAPPARSRSIDLGSLAGPLRLGMIYAGLALVAAAIGVRRMLAVR